MNLNPLIFLIFIFKGLLFCSNTITQVTEIFPNGIPKEITTYLVNENRFDLMLIPSTRYIYNPNGKLHKYQEWYKNGTKSKEILIQRDNIIERNWSSEGFPQDTHKYKLNEYPIPSFNSNIYDKYLENKDMKQSMNNSKKRLKEISSIVSELVNEIDLLKIEKNDSIDRLIDKHEILTNNKILSFEERLTKIENILNSINVNQTDNEEELSTNWEKKIDSKIDNIKHDIRILKNEIKYIKKEID